MVLEVLYWILLVLCIIGAFVPDSTSPYLLRGRWIIVLILLAILGLRVFGDPAHR